MKCENEFWFVITLRHVLQVTDKPNKDLPLPSAERIS
jgi:hypothetical protein